MVKIVRTRKSSSAPRIKPPVVAQPRATARRAQSQLAGKAIYHDNDEEEVGSSSMTGGGADSIMKNNAQADDEQDEEAEEHASVDLKCTETFDADQLLTPAATDNWIDESTKCDNDSNATTKNRRKRVLMTSLGMRVKVTNNLELAAREEQQKLMPATAAENVEQLIVATKKRKKSSDNPDDNDDEEDGNEDEEVVAPIDYLVHQQEEDGGDVAEKKKPAKRPRTVSKRLLDSPATSRTKRTTTTTTTTTRSTENTSNLTGKGGGKTNSVSCFGQPGVSSWAGQPSNRSNNWTPPTFKTGSSQGKNKSTSSKSSNPLQVSQPLYSWGVLRLGKELGSVALNEYLGRSRSSSADAAAGNFKMHGCDTPYSPEQTLQIIETLRPKTCVPPKDSFLHKVVLGRGQVGKAALTIKTLSDPDLQNALRSIYELMCKQDADDGSSFRRETQYMSALSCTDKLAALENTAFRLKLREDEVMAKSEEVKQKMASVNQSQNAVTRAKQNNFTPPTERRLPISGQSPGVMQLSHMFSPPPPRAVVPDDNKANVNKS